MPEARRQPADTVEVHFYCGFHHAPFQTTNLFGKYPYLIVEKIQNQFFITVSLLLQKVTNQKTIKCIFCDFCLFEKVIYIFRLKTLHNSFMIKKLVLNDFSKAYSSKKYRSTSFYFLQNSDYSFPQSFMKDSLGSNFCISGITNYCSASPTCFQVKNQEIIKHEVQ